MLLLQRLRDLWREDTAVDPSLPARLIFAPDRGGEATLHALDEALRLMRSPEASANDIRLSFQRGLSGWVIQVHTLRGMILLDAAHAVRQRARYRRCQHCQQWLELVRRDQLFCSDACRAAAFRAEGGGHGER